MSFREQTECETTVSTVAAAPGEVPSGLKVLASDQEGQLHDLTDAGYVLAAVPVAITHFDPDDDVLLSVLAHEGDPDDDGFITKYVQVIVFRVHPAHIEELVADGP